MSLTGCAKKAGDALRKVDRAAIFSAAQKYRKSGMSADDAGRKAITDQIDVVQKLLDAAMAGNVATPSGRLQEARDNSPVVQFGRAMRDAGLEFDGNDVRDWSVDVGEKGEVHARMHDKGVTNYTVYAMSEGKPTDNFVTTSLADAGAAVKRMIAELKAQEEAPAAPAKPAVKANAIFTEEAANAARAILKRKLGTLNSGLDPEMMQAGIALAGYHIERGARTFSAYSKAMIADLGDAIRPFLKSFYMAIKYDPRAASLDGMDSATVVENFKEEDFGKDIPVSQWWNAMPSSDRGDVLAKMQIGNQAPNTYWNDLKTENKAKITAFYTQKDQPVVDASDNPTAPSAPTAPTTDDGADGARDETPAQAEPAAPAAPAADIVEHVTTKGKTIRGVVRSDLTHPEAKAIDEYTFKKDGGYFIREKHLDALNAAHPLAAPEPAAPEVKATKTAQDLSDHFADLIANGGMPKDNPALKKLVEAFDGASPSPARMKQAQEALETAIVRTARKIVAAKEGPNSTYAALLRLYESQPLLNVRTSTSIENQAYSTPAPLAWMASELAGIDKSTTVLEPTAGNGMLLIGAKISNATTNELNDDRVASLKAQGFSPSQGDATTGFPGKAGTLDRVITNPPFGPIKDANSESIKVKYDGYTFGQIDHLIAAKALETMKDDGRAVLILGANKATGQKSNQDLIFFNWLYGNYNVTSHFEVEGDLYQRQGAGWPVRVITIQGRLKSSTFAPADGTIQRANTWSEVYEQFQQGMASTRTQAGSGSTAGSTKSAPTNDGAPVSAASDGKAGRTDPVVTGRSPAGNGNVSGPSTGTVGDSPAVPNEPVGERPGVKRPDAGPAVAGQLGGGERSGDAAKPAGNSRTAGVTADAENQFQAKYVARSARKDEGVLIPFNMAGPLQDALNRLEDEVGDLDAYVTKELGYKDTAALHDAFMGLQIDSVASAIYQIKNEKGVIIADQTGIGKGRQAAAIIRWAAKNGKIPVFVSVKPSLFTDMYGDLHDIGTDDIAPFILNSAESIKGANDEELFANRPSLHGRAIQAIARTGALPAGRNAVFMTYSQINVENAQRSAIMALAPNAVFVLDESHNAGGDSSTGSFIRGVLDASGGATYLSATYAKRPDNMPVYFKTDMGDAVSDDATLMSAMAAGGLPLQTVVSNNLVKAGQMFRRERSYDGVSIESRADTAHRDEHVKLSDETTLALRAIVAADRTFHENYVKSLQDELKAQGQNVLDTAGNQAQASVDHTQFSSVVHNFVRQMLLGLKAQEAADDAIRSLKRGEKPLIAVDNTMGSFLQSYVESNGIKQGESLGSFDYRTVLSRALARSRYIIRQLPNGDKVKEYIELGKLDPVSFEAYQDAQRVIDKLRLTIPVSPIDWMRSEITKAGYSVAEVTGRHLSVDYSDPKNPILSKIDERERKDKVRTTRQFNGGTVDAPIPENERLDALILNVAGSTGISLHSSEKFVDQRQRHMIVAQAAQDINIFMQMLGRIHRTGQVNLPKYTLLNADLPAEIRPTALLSGKMKSLNANTSSNTESATSVKASDMLNKYGDRIVGQYLADNPDLAKALGLDGTAEGGDPEEDIARKATGRLALMPVATQTAFYAEVEEQYQALIDYLDKTNQNELVPKTFDFDAMETRSVVMVQGQKPTSPFGEDAIYGEYSVKAQGKAMTPAEIRAAMAESLDGKHEADHAAALQGTLEEAYKGFFAGLHEGSQDMARIARSKGIAFVKDHKIGSMFRVTINEEVYNAVITNIRNTHKKNGNPFAMSKFQVTIALNGALRSVTVPGTQFNSIMTSGISGYGSSIEREFRVGAVNERETAKIITGNLLGAYGELNGTRGSIISFTKADGTNEQGILLPKSFSVKNNVRQDYRLKSASDVATFLARSDNENLERFGVNSRDSVVRVLPTDDRRGIIIQVPKSKAKGGKYFLDKALIAVAGDFVSQGSFMRATVEGRANSVAALELLMTKQALYTLPSMSEEARTILGDEPGTDLSAFSRPLKGVPIARGGQAASQVQDMVRQMTAKWTNAPKVVVVQNLDDPRVPAAVRAQAKGVQSTDEAGAPDGFYNPKDGSIFLIADKLAGDADILRVLMHESLGHYGLRGLYGADLGTILDRLSVLNAGKVRDAATILGLDYTDNAQRRLAAEEVLAYMAQNQPEIGWVKNAVAAVRTWLRDHVPGFSKMQMTDAELIRSYILPARRFVENGGPNGSGPGKSSGNVATRTPFSRGDSDGFAPSDEQSALAELRLADDMFALPKSDAKTVGDIARDNDPTIKVAHKRDMAGNDEYTFTMEDHSTATMTVRKANPYGDSVYSMELDMGEGSFNTERPGDNPEYVSPDTDDVYINVSERATGTDGAKIYNIAATFAHNTGRIFIGDPADLSDAAMRRRLEQMISSALKFGTTAHIAPHPYQVKGDRAIGVPPLRWVYGDHDGNFERMVDVSLKAMDNVFPQAKIISYHSDGRFYRTDKNLPFASRGQLRAVIEKWTRTQRQVVGSPAEKGQAGWRTVARNALFSHLRQAARTDAGGTGGSLLDRMREQRTGLRVDPDTGGAYSKESRILYSRNLGDALTAGLNNVRDVKLPAGYAVGDLLDSSGRLHWWHKSVGTMYHTAQKNPPFKRVYDAVQDFLGDVSFYAAEAADLAPSILPKLETWKDVARSPLSPEDTKALSAPVFAGTLTWGRDEMGVARPIDEITETLGATSVDDKAHMLMRAGHIDPKVLRMWQGLQVDKYEGIINAKFEKEVLKPGVVFTDGELKKHFGMTDAQVKLYQEFRSATDKSIDNLAISEMLRYAGKDAEFIRPAILDLGDIKEASALLRDQLMEAAEEQPNRSGVLMDAANKMIDIADHARDMKQRGYAPLSRFGSYTLEATLETGERFFSLYESARERNKAARMLMTAGATGLTTGTMSQEDYKLLNGVSPETAALFGEMLGLESQGSEAKDVAYQEFIKRGTANRSAMKRLIHRKGIAGFSEDAGRVLAGFVYSNGRKTSSNLHQGEITKAVSDIPKEQGELKDAAVKLRDYVSNPQEEAQSFRAILFAQYLGGSVASAMVNATQPFAVTFPYLSQFGGIRKAAERMVAAANDATKDKTGDARLDAALRHAEEAGIVSPQEVHHLQAQASGRAQLVSGDGTLAGNALAKGMNGVSKLSLAWGKVFGVAEQFNRRVTFIAAYRTAIEQRIADPAGFAAKAVAETQFTYNKGNKPRWARGAVGSVLFTFKQYGVNYIELLVRMGTAGEPGSQERLEGQKAALLALAVLFLMAGADGLPFMEDAQDLIDGAMQRLGYNFSTKQQLKAFLATQIGKDGAEFMMSGISGLPGAPIDVSGRLGMGNLLPGTGLFQKKTDYGRDLMEFAGPAGDFVKRAATAAGQTIKGDIAGAAETISPTAARNVIKAIDMADTGMYRDTRGRKVIDTTVGEALAKSIGFQPRTVAKVQEASGEVARQRAQYTLALSEIREKWALGIFEGDESKKNGARDDLAAWNANNPDQRMTANMGAILARVREMRKTKAQRLTDTAPKGIRAQVRKQLAEDATS